jgi:hypothetical protein
VSGQRATIALPTQARGKIWIIPVGAAVLAIPVAVFLLWPRLHSKTLQSTPAIQPADSAPLPKPPAPPPHETVETAKKFAAPHELTIENIASYSWFDPGTRQPAVWYAPASDGNFRFFDGPGIDPQSGRDLEPVTPDFVADLKKRQSAHVAATAPKPARPADLIKPRDAPANGTEDRFREELELRVEALQAQSALNQRNYQSAIDICTSVLTTSAGSQPCTAIRQRASVKLAEQLVDESASYWEKGEFDKALRSAERALGLDPANKHAARLKALALRMKAQGP